MNIYEKAENESGKAREKMKQKHKKRKHENRKNR